MCNSCYLQSNKLWHVTLILNTNDRHPRHLKSSIEGSNAMGIHHCSLDHDGILIVASLVANLSSTTTTTKNFRNTTIILNRNLFVEWSKWSALESGGGVRWFWWWNLEKRWRLKMVVSSGGDFDDDGGIRWQRGGVWSLSGGIRWRWGVPC